MTTTLQVKKTALTQTRLSHSADLHLSEGQVRLRVDSFALTSNNITYAAFGDTMSYWHFYPTPAAESDWGVIPVWGFAEVVESRCDGLALGERFYGYYPMADSVVFTPSRVSKGGFTEGAANRAGLALVYNQYSRSTQDAFYQAGTEDIQSLLRPLFITSWLIDDFLADNAFFGANTCLLSSASSKTAYGTAFMLAKRPGMAVVGLTSEGNRAFCERLGCYSRVVTYDELPALDADAPCLYVDFAGNADLRKTIHTRFSALAYSCSIGGTHVESLGSGRDLPGPRATLFFAPAQVKKRHADWGPAEFGARLLAGWQDFTATATTGGNPWLRAQRATGAQAALAAYAQVLAGRGDPTLGQIVSMQGA